MDRRKLLKQAGAVACVAAVPVTFTEFSNALTPAWTKINWTETPGSIAHFETIKSLGEKFKASGKKVDALTPEEWTTLANAHQSYMTFHAETGDLHRIDNQIKANETYLKSKYPTKYVDSLLEYGAFAHVSFESTQMHAVATKLQAGYTPAAFKLKPVVTGSGCQGAPDLFFGGVSALYIILGLVLGLFLWELAVIFAVLGLLTEGTREFVCA